jgi:hypothetical protein
MPTIWQVLALVVPAPAFTWWMLANPPKIGWLGAGGFASTLLLTGVLALVARYRPPCRVREHGAGFGCWWPAVMMVDRHVRELPPAAPHGIATIAPEAMAWAHDAHQLLDVEMHELARL